MTPRHRADDRRVRVLCVVPNLDVGGAERHMVALLERMDRGRFVPSLVCIGHEGPFFAAVRAAGVPATALHRTKRQFPLTVADLVRHMRRTAPDIVIVRSYNAEVLGRAAAVLAGVPATAVWVHSTVDIRPRSRIRVLADRVLDRCTTSYYGVAHGQMPYLTGTLRYPAEKISVVHTGIDLAGWAPRGGSARDSACAASLGVGEDDLVVGCVAVLRAEKDHATLLRAWSRVLAAVPRGLLLIVGDGPRRAELERLAGELGVAGRVRFTGARSDVADVLRVLDVFTLTSVTEAFPVSVLEAMASGVPTVCTDVGGIPEMVVDGVTGALVPAGDPDSLATCLVDVLRDAGRRDAMGRAARRRAEEEFDLDLSVRRTEAMIIDTALRGGSETARV